MTLDNFIPEIWSAKLLESLHKNLVYAQPAVSNSDYEGDISGLGDTVRITSIGAVTVRDYTKDSDIDAPEALDDAQATLLIDQGKYFNFAIDDVDKAQQKPKVMSAAMSDASYALADTADQYVAALYSEAGVEYGSQGSPKVPSAVAGSTMFDYLIDLGILLSEAGCPKPGRYVVLPSWAIGRLATDDKFASVAASGSDEALRNGFVGRAAGFDILESLNVPVDTAVYKVLAGTSQGITYAEQIRKVEAYRPERRFSDAVKGLHLYGAKVVRPYCLGVLHLSKT